MAKGDTEDRDYTVELWQENDDGDRLVYTRPGFHCIETAKAHAERHRDMQDARVAYVRDEDGRILDKCRLVWSEWETEQGF